MINIHQSAQIHGFDEPLGLLADCHRRIEHFLGILLRVGTDFATRPLTDEAAEAIRVAKHYFAVAAPKHTADEEESLFPRMKASAQAGSGAGETLARLEADHHVADALHTGVDDLLARWLAARSLTAGESQSLRAQLEQLRAIYQEHIRIEEEDVFPLAARLLTDEQLSTVGAEMRDRRGLPAGAGSAAGTE